MIARIRPPGLFLSWLMAAFLGALLALGGAALWRGSSAGTNATDENFFSDVLIQRAYADVGKGEHIFLPHRMAMWVINRTNGKIIHYLFYDNQVGTVERSRVGQINPEIFPPSDTGFVLSNRNLTSYLWVVNYATGDFQVWRSNRDGTLSTDAFPVPAGEDLRSVSISPPKTTQTSKP